MRPRCESDGPAHTARAQCRDALLLSRTTLLRQQLREANVAARLGGDEFAILLSQPNASHVQLVSERPCKPCATKSYRLQSSPLAAQSIGLTLFPEHGTTVDVVLAHTALVLYQAKTSGRNVYCVYTPCLKT